MELDKELKRLRKERGITQEYLAKKLYVSVLAHFLYLDFCLKRKFDFNMIFNEKGPGLTDPALQNML